MMKLILSILTITLYISRIDGQATFLYENDLCKAGDNRWTCKKLNDCPSAKKLLKNGGRPQICTFLGLEPVVCCGPDQNEPSVVQTLTQPQQTRPGSNRVSKAEEKCKEYAKYVYREELPPVLPAFGNPKPIKWDECASSHETLIVGGEKAQPKEFPHMAQIGYEYNGKIDWLCGGSLISERYVLSAAHCTIGGYRGPAKWARLGDLNITTDQDDARPVTVEIVERINHPDYNNVQLYNDIALYKLAKDVPLSPYLRPICLDYSQRQTKTALATGWGRVEWGGRSSDALMKVSLNRVSAEECNKTFASNIGKQLPSGILPSSQLCAGGEEGKDTCQGDSGGPLQLTAKEPDEPYCMYIQIGITSFGKACGYSNPGVYTKVANYLTWIERIVWP